MADKFLATVADRAIEGLYQPGQYVRAGDLAAGPVRETADGGLTFTVESTVPNTDRQHCTVTISRGEPSRA